MINVLIADDSPTCRVLLRGLLKEDEGFAVVGEARDGSEAVAMTASLKPDIVVMDMLMPNMDGLSATREIMSCTPTPIVIVSSSSSVHESTTAMKALACGALTLIEKPALTSPERMTSDLVSEFTKTVRLMSSIKVFTHRRRAPGQDPVADLLRHQPVVSPSLSGRYRYVPDKIPRAVGIAASTGGPPVLLKIAQSLPADYPIPILVVQHIGAGFTEGLCDWLNRESDVQIKVAEAGESLLPATIYVAPSEFHLGASQSGHVQLSATPSIGGFRPSATFLFESLSAAFGSECLAMVLTGMGEDGIRGLSSVKRKGGFVVAQDERSSTVFGMPAKAIESGKTDVILPLDMMPLYFKELASL